MPTFHADRLEPMPPAMVRRDVRVNTTARVELGQSVS
jgi:hypothetical protein